MLKQKPEMQVFSTWDIETQMDVVRTAILGSPLDHLSPTGELPASASLQEATRKLILTKRVKEAIGLEAQDFRALGLKEQLDIVHIAIFGWPLDAFSPTDELLATGSLQQATHKLMASERSRWFTREAMPAWPVDKWVCAEFAGLRIWVNLSDSYVAYGVLRGDWENKEVGFMLDHLAPGDAMVDVGANVGVYTLQAARAVGPSGRIYAFEPQTDIFNMLTRSVRENAFEDRCILDNCAVGDRDTLAAIWRHHANNPGASIVTTQENVPEGCGNATVLKRLDSLEFDRPVKLLKMDIEGYEPLLVAGGSAFFRTHRPIILTEWFPRAMQQVAGSSPRIFYDQLAALGYQIRFLEGRNLGEVLTRDNLGVYDNIEEPFNIACIPQ